MVIGLIVLVVIFFDFGNVVVIFLIILVLFLVSGVNYVYILIVGVGGFCLSIFMIWLINIINGKILFGCL